MTAAIHEPMKTKSCNTKKNGPPQTENEFNGIHTNQTLPVVRAEVYGLESWKTVQCIQLNWKKPSKKVNPEITNLSINSKSIVWGVKLQHID